MNELVPYILQQMQSKPAGLFGLDVAANNVPIKLDEDIYSELLHQNEQNSFGLPEISTLTKYDSTPIFSKPSYLGSILGSTLPSLTKPGFIKPYSTMTTLDKIKFKNPLAGKSSLQDSLKNNDLFKATGGSPKGQFLKNLGNVGKAAAAGIASALNPGLQKWIGGDYDDRGIGKGIATLGNTAAGVVSMVPGVGWAAAPLISLASGVLGGAITRTTGTDWNEQGIANSKRLTANNRMYGRGLGNTNVAADVINASGNIRNQDLAMSDVGKKGILSTGTRLKNKYNSLNNAANSSYAYATNAFINAAHNVDRTTDDIAEMNSGKYGTSYAAFGGPLNTIGSNTGMGAIDYGFGMDFMRHLDNKDKMSSKMSVPSMSGTLFNPFGLGGVMQSHGADWSTGARHINAGGTHEENPYEGVPMGMDNEGNPNVVEEGEVIVNDYVFSDRIYCDAETKKIFHISKKRKITFADLAKKLEKEVSERPNDPISKASYKRQIAKLQEQQERQKAEEQEAKQRVEFDKLSPEEKQALLEQLMAEQQQGQQQGQEEAMAQEAMAQQMGGMPQGTEEQIPPDAVAQQQMMAPQMGQMAAHGGKLNKFAPGGPLDGDDINKSWEYYNWVKNKLGITDDTGINSIPISFLEALHSAYYNQDTSFNELYNSKDSLYNYILNDYLNRSLDSLSDVDLRGLYSDFVSDVNNNGATAYDYLSNLEASTPVSTQSPVQVSQSAPPPIVAQPQATTAPSAVVSSSTPSIDNNELLKAIYGRIGGIYGRSGFDRWAKKNNVTNYDLDNAQELLKNQSFLDAIKQSDSSLSHVLGDGYDFGLRQLDGAEPVVNTYTGGSWNLDRGYNNYYDSWHVGGDESKWDAAWARIEKEKMWEKLGISDPTQLTRKNIEELMRMTPEYNDTTKLLQENEDLRLRYLLDMATAAEDNPYVSPAAKNYALKFVDPETKTWRPEYKDNHSYETVLQKERENNAGNYWKSIIDKYRNSTIKNWIQNEDGEWELMDVAPPTDWKPTTYNWNSSDGKMTYNYYVDPNSKAGKKAAEEAAKNKEGAEKLREIVPRLKSEAARYVGLFGPAVGLGLWAAGVGKPDFKDLDAAVARTGRANLAGYQPIAAPYKYQPQDTFFPSIQNANAYTAANRNIMNTAAPSGSINAGLVNSAYNAVTNNGDLAIKTGLANREGAMKKAMYDADIAQKNAAAYDATSQFNASALNHANDMYANAALHAAGLKMDANAGWYNSLYGNISNLFKGISDYGRENADYNLLARLASTGALGTMDKDNPMGSGLFYYSDEEPEINKKRRYGYIV